MKQEVMKKWVKALRSGKYKQCQESLCKINPDDGSESFCCLGVLMDLYLQDRKNQKKGPGIKHLIVNEGDEEERYQVDKWVVDGEPGLLPKEVAKWAGFNMTNAENSIDSHPWQVGKFTISKNNTVTLTELNDGYPFPYVPAKTFKYIAKVIEKNYKNI
jgi:hypothetical protein